MRGAPTIPPAWEDLRSLDADRRAQAFTDLWNAMKGNMFAFSYRLLGNGSDAEDVVQDAMTNLIYSIRRAQPQCAPDMYLMRIVRNSCMDVLRRREADRRKIGVVAGHTNSEANPSELLEQHESLVAWKERLRQAFLSLSFTDRTVIVLKHILGYANSACAEILSVSRNAFDVRLHRALKSLKEQVDRKTTSGEDSP